MSEILLGIDVGGSKIEAAVLLRDPLEVIARMRVDTNAHLGYDHIVSTISGLVKDIQKQSHHRFEKVGIGTPGTLDPLSMTMKNCNTIVLNGRHFHTDLEQALGMKVRLSNDANCFAVAEANLGIVPDILPDAKVVYGLIIGTGTGSGLVVDGKVIGGRQGIGGEWGHNHLDDSGGLCYCGKTGCVEMVISGPALEKYYAKQSGSSSKMSKIVDMYRNGSDSIATETMQRLFDYFGKAISVIINIVDPDIIVIGGGLGNIDELYTHGVEAIKPHIFNNHRVDTIFVKPKLGDSAGVFGAALLW